MKISKPSDFFPIIALFILFLASCRLEVLPPKPHYLISAKITGIPDGKAVLAKIDLKTNERVDIDTVSIRDGKFTFQGKVNSPYSHTIIINDTLGKIHFFLENSKIHITGVVDDLDKVKITGSREDSLFRSYHIDSIFEKKSGMEIMTNHPTYTFAAFVAYYQFQIHSYDVDTIQSIIDNFSEDVQKSTYYEHLIKLHETIKHVAISAPAPDFSIPNTIGETIQLNDFKGKYILLDFWASWCAPCRASNPALLKVYEQFKKNDFEIIGISVDKDKSQWLKAIKDDKLTWTNLSNVKGWDDVTNLYGVKAVPQNFLINRDGIIIAKNIKEDKMVETLEAIFK